MRFCGTSVLNRGFSASLSSVVGFLVSGERDAQSDAASGFGAWGVGTQGMARLVLGCGVGCVGMPSVSYAVAARARAPRRGPGCPRGPRVCRSRTDEAEGAEADATGVAAFVEKVAVSLSRSNSRAGMMDVDLNVKRHSTKERDCDVVPDLEECEVDFDADPNATKVFVLGPYISKGEGDNKTRKEINQMHENGKIVVVSLISFFVSFVLARGSQG